MSWTLFIEVGIFAFLMGIVAWALFVPPRHLRETKKNNNKKDEIESEGGNKE
jgi:hypothetical protein